MTSLWLHLLFADEKPRSVESLGVILSLVGVVGDL